MSRANASPRTGWLRFLPLLIVVLVLAAYSNSFRGPFLGDDFPSVVNNHDLRSPWTALRAVADDRQNSISGRPAVAVTFSLNYWLHGLSVEGYHVTNVAIHLLNALLLFGLVRRTIGFGYRQQGQQNSGSSAAWAVIAAFSVSAIWAVHPLHTESVNYVVQRTELLVGFFCLLMLYSAARGNSSSSPIWTLLAVVSCALGMLSKEVMAAAPLLVLLYDYTICGLSMAQALKRRPGMYAGLGACWVLLAAMVWAGPRSDTVGFSRGITPWEYLLTQASVIVHYLRLAVWPAPLVISYHDWPVIDRIMPVLPQAGLLVGALVASVYGVILRRWWGFLGLCFFLILAPSSSFVPIVTEVAAERRMYLPLAALIAGIVLAGGRVVSVRMAPPSAATMAVLPALLLAALTSIRNRDYRDDLTIWADAAAKRPLNAVAHNGVAFGLKQRGDLNAALTAATEAVRLDPQYTEGRFQRAHILQLLGQHAQAVAEYRQVIQQDQTYNDAYYNLSLALERLGQTKEAVAVLESLSAMEPKNPRAARTLAVCLAKLGLQQEALVQARRAVALEPDRTDARYNLGWLLSQTGDHAGAGEQFRAVLAASPTDIDARLALGAALEQLGDRSGAAREYRQALALQPGNVRAREAVDRLAGP